MLTDALKRLSRHSLAYALVPALHRLLGSLLLPLVTAWIGTRANYGVVEMAGVTLAVAAQVLGVNLLQGMTRYYKQYATEAERRALVGTCVLILLGTTGVAFALAWTFAERGAELLFGAREHAGVLRLTAGILVAQTVSQAGLRWLQILERSATYGAVTTVKLLLEIGLKVWFLVGLHLEHMGVLYSVLGGELAVALGVGVALLGAGSFAFSGAMARRLVRYSAPLLVSGLCGFVLHQGDRFFVLRDGGADQVGLYAVAYKLGSIASTVVFDAFALIWFPFVFAMSDGAELARLVRAVLVYLTLLMSACTLALALFGPEITRVMADPSFFDAHRALPVVALGYLFWVVYQVVATVFYVRERTGIVSLLVAGAAAVNLAANAVLVPRLGYQGAAWATLATFAVLAAGAWIAAERVWRVGHETVRVLAPIALALALYLGVRALAPPPGSTGIVERLVALLLLPGILWPAGYLNAREKEKITALVKRGFRAVVRRG